MGTRAQIHKTLGTKNPIKAKLFGYQESNDPLY